MNIFFITYCFPPLLSPASFRLMKWFKGLEELGHTITVLSIYPDSFVGPKDETMCQLIPANVDNIQVWSLENTILFRALRKQYKLFYRFFEPRKMEWYYPAIRRAKQVDFNKYDLIVSCSQPHSCHLIGYYLKERTGKPWVAYFSDPWSDNPYAVYPSEKIRLYNIALEKKVMGKADKIIFPSDAMGRMVTGKYGDGIASKCHTLAHCFVPGWYSIDTSVEESNGNKKIRFIHTGNFYGPRSPKPILSALAELNREVRLEEKIEIRFYGNVSQEAIDFVAQNNLQSFIKFYPSIPYLQSLSVMSSADYLILIDAPLAKETESVFLPSKLIDYIGSGRPVIGFTPVNGVSASILKKTGNIAIDIDNQNDIYAILDNIISERTSWESDKDKIMNFHYKNITKEWNKYFNL